MRNLTYLAVFEPSTDGSYSIYFPDLPGCISVYDIKWKEQPAFYEMKNYKSVTFISQMTFYF